MARDQVYREAEQRIEKARQEGAIKLSLARMKLTEVPEALASLTQLQVLHLSGNPLDPDLAAAYGQGTEAVWQYLRRRAEEQITVTSPDADAKSI